MNTLSKTRDAPIAPMSALMLPLLLVLAGSARAADDSKGISGASCQPAKPSDASSLTYGAAGVTNISAYYARTVVCPLLTDAEAGSTQAVDVYFPNGDATCTLSLVYFDIDEMMAAPLIVNVSPFVSGHSPGAPFHVFFNPSSARLSAEWAPMTVTCSLAPGTTLTEIRYMEFADTDDPAH